MAERTRNQIPPKEEGRQPSGSEIGRIVTKSKTAIYYPWKTPTVAYSADSMLMKVKKGDVSP